MLQTMKSNHHFHSQSTENESSSFLEIVNLHSMKNERQYVENVGDLYTDILNNNTNKCGSRSSCEPFSFTFVDVEKYISCKKGNILPLSKEIMDKLTRINATIAPPPIPQHFNENTLQSSSHYKQHNTQHPPTQQYCKYSRNNTAQVEKEFLSQHQQHQSWKSKKYAQPEDFRSLTKQVNPSRKGSSKLSFETTTSSSSSSEMSNWIEEKKKDRVPFVATKIEKKTGIEHSINEIRVLLNKLTLKNYETQSEKLFDLMKETDSDSTHILAPVIFNLASSNTFQGELYARLYTDILEKNINDTKEIFQEILLEFLRQFKDSIENEDIEYVDPEVDYDKYCKFVKEIDRKKAITKFVFYLYKNGIIAETVIIELTEYFLNIFKENIDVCNKIQELDEWVEIIHIFISMGSKIDLLMEHLQWKQIMEMIKEISQMKVKEHKSLSSKALFKVQALLKK